MNANCGNWSFGSISASSNIREECVPDNRGQLLAICALVQGMIVSGCGKYREITDYVWEKCCCYVVDYC